MTEVECNGCKSQRHCPAKGEMHRLTAIAWAHDRDALPCPFFTPAWHHGIEGVSVSPPRPLRFVGRQIHHHEVTR